MTEEKKLNNITLIIGAYGNLPSLIGVVEKQVEPPEGGIFSKLMGCSYLFKGFPNVKIVHSLRTFKKALTVLPPVINTKLGRIMVVIFVLMPKFIQKEFILKFCIGWRELAYDPIQASVLPKEKYCVAVRELYRVLTFFIGKLKDGRIKEIADWGRNSACMILEYDSPYKFMVQDVLPEINKEAFMKNPAKEFQRIVDIFLKRSVTDEMEIGLRPLFKIISLALRFSRKARRIAKEFISEIDLEKVKLDEADRYFCMLRDNYDFWGTPFEERKLMKEKIDKEKGHKIPEVRFEQAPVATPTS